MMSDKTGRSGLLLVLSGPSGSGKGSVSKLLLDRRPDIVLSISATTRAPRGDERDSVEYFFHTQESFERLIAEDGFLEYEVNFSKDSYGTPKAFVLDNLSAGRDVLLEIDVKGALKVKRAFPDAVTIFIMPPSFKILRERLTLRDTESKADIELRMETAAGEMRRAREFDYFILNDELKAAVDDMEVVVRAAKLSVDRNITTIDRILEACDS